MGSLRKYTQLKGKVEEAQQTADQAEGGFGQVMKQLKNEFECTSLESAEKKTRIIKKQAAEAKEEFEEALEKFEEDWPDELD